MRKYAIRLSQRCRQRVLRLGHWSPAKVVGEDTPVAQAVVGGNCCHRSFVWILLLTALLPLVSCRRAAEQAQRNIRIEAVEAIERRGLTGVEVVVRVKNDTGRKLILKAASFEVFYAGDRVAEIDLRKGVEVPRHTTGSFSTLWRMRSSDPLVWSVLSRKIAQEDVSQIGVSFTLNGRGGLIPVKISQEMMPLSEFLNTFEVSLDDVKNYLKE